MRAEKHDMQIKAMRADRRRHRFTLRTFVFVVACCPTWEGYPCRFINYNRIILQSHIFWKTILWKSPLSTSMIVGTRGVSFVQFAGEASDRFESLSATESSNAPAAGN